MKVSRAKLGSISRISPVASPAVPAAAMKQKASGMPPKLASTPEAVSTACLSSRPRDWAMACAVTRPTTAEMTAVSRDSRIEPHIAVR